MSKASLDLVMPALLRKRIKEFKIPPAPGQANYEKVLIYQIPDNEMGGEKFGKDSSIYKPDTLKDRDKDRCPRGVIASAGLKARDILHDHGMDVGEMVLFSPHAPTRFETKRDGDGKMVSFYFMHVSDGSIVSEDVPQRLSDGDLELVRKDGSYQYVWKNEEAGGARRDPDEFDDTI